MGVRGADRHRPAGRGERLPARRRVGQRRRPEGLFGRTRLESRRRHPHDDRLGVHVGDAAAARAPHTARSRTTAHLCRPHVVDRIVDERRRDRARRSTASATAPCPTRRTSSTTSANALTQVPVSGTATDAVPRVPAVGGPGCRQDRHGVSAATPFQDTSWFAAMVPANDPKYVVVAMVEQAGFGSTWPRPSCGA